MQMKEFNNTKNYTYHSDPAYDFPRFLRQPNGQIKMQTTKSTFDYQL